MATRSPRTIPPHDTPFLDSQGRVHDLWYSWFKQMGEALGGTRLDRVVRSPATGAAVSNPSGIAGAVGTVTLTIDGVDYEVTHE